MSQPANSLTIRDEDGEVIGRPYVGSQAMKWTPRTGTLRSMSGTMIQIWIGMESERRAVAGDDRAEFLDQVVTVRDEYRY